MNYILWLCNLVKDYPRKRFPGLLLVATTIVSRNMTSHVTISGFGNAYATKKEGDQAMSAYRTAAHLFHGCHLSTLYIGLCCQSPLRRAPRPTVSIQPPVKNHTQ